MTVDSVRLAMRRESDRRELEYLQGMEKLNKDHARGLTTVDEFAERVENLTCFFLGEQSRASVAEQR